MLQEPQRSLGVFDLARWLQAGRLIGYASANALPSVLPC
jgi:hypothetical protein